MQLSILIYITHYLAMVADVYRFTLKSSELQIISSMFDICNLKSGWLHWYFSSHTSVTNDWGILEELMVLPNNGKHSSSFEVDQMNGTQDMQITDMEKDRDSLLHDYFKILSSPFPFSQFVPWVVFWERYYEKNRLNRSSISCVTISPETLIWWRADAHGNVSNHSVGWIRLGLWVGYGQ